MKFKNSYILLIAMAIFLLVSIGSVCASENVTADSDDVLANSDDNVVLADEDTLGDETTQEKINTSITATSDTEKYDYDEDKNITINVKDNETKDVEGINQSNLTVFEGNTSINFAYNNSILTITDQLSVGNHTLIITYLGNSNYTNSSTEFLLKIIGNKTLEADETIVSDGTTVDISNVKVFDGVEYIDLSKDNFTVTLTYTNKTGNSTTVNITDITFGNETVSFNNTYEWIKASVTLSYAGAVNNITSNIYLSTSVNLTNEEKVRDSENKTITVNVLDNEDAQLNITQSDLTVLDNGNSVAFTYNNSVITITSLAIGNHTITVIYNGNDTYYTSNKTTTLNVYGNKTIAPESPVAVDSNRDVTIVLNLSDGVDPVEITKENLTIVLFYTNGNVTSNRTLTQNNITIDGQNVIFNVPETFESAYVNIAYAAETNLTATVTLKIETAINSDDVIVKGEGEVLNFTANVTASDGYALNVTSDNFKVYNGDTLLNTTYSNSTFTINDKLTYGIYNLTIKFTGDDTYNDITKDIVLKIYGINLNNTSVNVNSTKKGEVYFNITNGEDFFNFTKEDITIKVNYTSGNDTVNVTVTSWNITNGTLSFELEDANFTTATLTISYNNTSTNVTLKRIYNANIIPINVTADYQDGNFTFKLIDIDTGDVITNQTVTISMTKNGTSIYFITKTSSGGYNLGTTITLTSDENGIVTLNNSGFYPGLQIADLIYAPAGTYETTIKGTDVVSGTNKTNITINTIDVNLVLGSFSEYYGTSKKVTITVTNAKTGKTVYGVYILLNITGATLSSPNQITDANGTIQLGVSSLPTGTYTMTFKTNDTNLNNASGSGSFKINKIPVVITGKNVKVYFNTGTTYTIKVTKNGKGVSGVYVFVRLYTTSKKYNDYLFQTNSKGKISFSASLAVGKHKILVTLADTRYSASQITKTITVKKATAKIKAKKVKTYYKAGKYFTVKLTNKKNKKPIYDAKVNIKIYVSKTKYYNYNGNTGTNGKIKLLLDSLKPKSYKVVVSGASSKNYKAKSVTSKIVIKKAPTKLIAKKVKAKKGAKKYFKVKAKNKKTKKVIAKIKLKVKVYTGKKYKTYKVKTNSKGIAKLSTKKLKVGKHKVVVTSANKYCKAKKIKSKITIKK